MSWKGLIPWLLGLFAAYVYTLPLAFFLIFVPEAIWGWSIGKKMLGIKIEGKPKDLWLRFILKTSGAWGITLALVIGCWQFLVFSVVAGLVILLGGLPDRLAGTEVS